jgi:hypothetical protein
MERISPVHVVVVAAAAALLATLAAGREEFLGRIPNGYAHKDAASGIACAAVGHAQCGSGNPRNSFGTDFHSEHNQWTKAVCEKDSDGDGQTNGEELGDPCCEWTTSNKAPKEFRTTQLSNPADAADTNAAPKCGEKAATPAPSAGTATSAAPASSGAATSAAPASSGAATSAPSPPRDAATDAPSPPSDAPKASGSCFPANALVTLESGAVQRMDRLAVGDVVLVGPGTYSPVFMFTHKEAGGVNDFVLLTTLSGDAVALTAGHYLPVSGRGLVAAGAVEVGDALTQGSGGQARVATAQVVQLRGLYNPQTLQGDIVSSVGDAGGVVASTYTTMVAPAVAHAALSPLRALYKHLSLSLACFDHGSPLSLPSALRGTHGNAV